MREQLISLALIVVKSRKESILLFDSAAVGVPGIFRGGGFLFFFIAGRIIVVVIAAVIIIAFVLRHIDVVEDDAEEIAADFFDDLLGAEVHRLRIAAVLDDLHYHVNFTCQNRGVAHAQNRR